MDLDCWVQRRDEAIERAEQAEALLRSWGWCIRGTLIQERARYVWDWIGVEMVFLYPPFTTHTYRGTSLVGTVHGDNYPFIWAGLLEQVTESLRLYPGDIKQPIN